MSFFGKVYNLVNQENVDGWLKSEGFPDDKVKAIMAQKVSFKIDKNGDTYSVTQSSSSGDRTVVFKSGVEVDDTLGEEKIPVKSTYIVDGNTVTQSIKGSAGTATFKREFNGDELVVTITSEKFDGVAKRFYKA